MFLTGRYDVKPEEQLTCTPCKDYMHMLQLQGTVTAQLSALAKRCSFSSITVIPKLVLEPTSQS